MKNQEIVVILTVLALVCIVFGAAVSKPKDNLSLRVSAFPDEQGWANIVVLFPQAEAVDADYALVEIFFWDEYAGQTILRRRICVVNAIAGAPVACDPMPGVKIARIRDTKVTLLKTVSQQKLALSKMR